MFVIFFCGGLREFFQNPCVGGVRAAVSAPRTASTGNPYFEGCATADPRFAARPKGIRFNDSARYTVSRIHRWCDMRCDILKKSVAKKSVIVLTFWVENNKQTNE